MGCRLCVLCGNARGTWAWLHGPVGQRRADAVCDTCSALIGAVDAAMRVVVR